MDYNGYNLFYISKFYRKWIKKEVTDSVNRVNPNKTRIYFESSDSNMDNMETFLNPFKLEDIEELSFIEGVERIGASKDDFGMGSMYYLDAYFDKKLHI